MSDIQKAEKLLREAAEVLDGLRTSGYNHPMEQSLRNGIREYFRKTAHIRDGFDRSVQVFIDSNEDLVMEWQDPDNPPVLFNAYELVGALKEIGVI